MFVQFCRALETAHRLHRNAWHPPMPNKAHMERVRGIIN